MDSTGQATAELTPGSRPQHEKLFKSKKYTKIAALMGEVRVRQLLIISLFALFGSAALAADSDLLDSVKRNPQLAARMCRQFKDLNSKGKSAYSMKTTKQVAAAQKLTNQDAEVLVTYVVGMHCPDVR